IALHFERAPFITQEHTLWLPWGRFFVMDTIVMRHEENDIPSCDLSSFSRPVPVVSPAPLTAFAGSCSERGTVVPEIQVIFRLPPSSLPCRKNLSGSLLEITLA
ncbi:Teneurin-4, partial [Goodea atripinnis]